MPTPSTSNSLVRGRELAIQTVHESNLRSQHLEAFFNSITDGSIGLAPIYGTNVALATLVIVSNTNALVVHFSSGKASGQSKKARTLLQDALLSEDSITKYAFLMDKLTFSLYHGFKIRVASAQSLLKPQADDDIHHSTVGDALTGVPGKIAKEELVQLFKNNEGKGTSVEEAARQAWLAYHAGSSPSRQSKLTLFDSSTQHNTHLQAISQLYCLAIRLRLLKPDVVKNDIDSKFKVGKGSVELTSTRFKTRITQTSTRQNLEIKIRNEQGQVVDIAAKTKKVNGRGVQVATTKSMATAASIVSVKTYGREPPTNIESTRHRLLANVLQGTVTLLKNPFVQAIFFPQDPKTQWPSPIRRPIPRSVVQTSRALNSSQTKAVEAIISLDDRHRVVMIHGPPGTGKTTVIAASTQSIVQSDPLATVYLIAHSNVAVKNIAEKLVNSDFLDFRIIVSREFHFDWHEHLYEKVEGNLIRTDSLPDDPLAAQRLLLGARVILSTLSNIINQKMAEITRVVPVETLVIDEASQIDVGDYLPAINRYQRTLQKLVFIGDDKQLAPYGQEQIKELQSIFEKRHLRGSAILLDTQYRMPVSIGSFISKHVYGGKLNTSHSGTLRKPCRFIDVRNSNEEKRGHSWINKREAQVVIAVAKQLNESGLAYRIITPYDPQRSYLESELQREKLPHKDKCFNVDSFQGNEADYIIVSLVRSGNKLGFLQEDRRVNVMLTRCKKAMIVCTNRTFVENVAQKSLVGKLASSLEGDPWVEARRILYTKLNLFA
ncbi:hypothetical protein EST38_g3023 [Candolleomyces aberdarensis]|uniref:Helicase ATP-binding domain-containing protein n=1 Tax=Candolleomyces aberdarensis TaxID=2316362 RepID=A0A4Q2DRI9_9AGAR|nr:hypothetical protein EST38_g3023 [Candolleomyces aberdarensis]